MNTENGKMENLTIAASVFACTLLVGACSTIHKSNECVECVKHRADLGGLKGYEVVKCLKEPTKYNY
jgi:hypothetical protein